MSVTIVVAIVILLVALVCYAFISQIIEKKHKQKQRLLAALKIRSRNFKHMLDGIPAGFLPRDIVLLVHRSLIDTCEQLTQLDPHDSSHAQDIKLYSEKIQGIKRSSAPEKPKTPQNPQQIKEIRQHLQELNKFIYQMEKNGSLPTAQSEIYHRQIRQLIAQISADAYILQARKEQQNGKKKLAVHYYGLARKLLLTERTENSFQGQLSKLESILQQLNQQIKEEEPEDQKTTEFSDTNESWKKKNVYD